MTVDAHQTVELLAATGLVVTGLSHVLHHRGWSDLFVGWAERGTSGALMNGLLHAAVGAFFVATHPVFGGARSITTWWAALVLAKGLTYLVAPELGLRQMRRLTPERAERLRWIGVPMAALGVVIGALALWRTP